MNVKHVIWASIMSTTISCQSVKKEYTSFEEYPIPEGKLVEMEYSPIETKFTLWAPTAEEVRLLLYDSGNEGSAYQTLSLEMGEDGIWNTSIKEDLKGKFYTFNVKVNGKWLGDTPGIMAKAVGVNGKRAAVIDLRSTDPEGWANDVRPLLKDYADIIVYEMHHRDFSLDSVSGIRNKGKFLALTELGTTTSQGEKTGIDHLKELGVTHVHILPSYDEYLLGYKDRTDVLPKEHYPKAFTNNGLFYPVILHEGQVIGNWSKSAKKGSASIECSWFRSNDCVDETVLNQEKDKYMRFWQ